MSITNIPDKVRVELWAKAAGRCQYPSCNEPLWRDPRSLRSMNRSYLAHIVADVPGGPRGHPTQSAQLKDQISNIMLLCDTHHRLIDDVDVEGHPVETLREYKRQHEERIERVTSMEDVARTEIVKLGARIGNRPGLVTFEQAQEAISTDRYPASQQGITIDLSSLPLCEGDPEFWSTAKTTIDRRIETVFSSGVGPSGDPLSHLSVFALAPIPLLIYFGFRLGDIYPADIFQLHRVPPTWRWQDLADHDFDYRVEYPEVSGAAAGSVAVNLSLSGIVHTEEIVGVIGQGAPMYKMSTPRAVRDFLQAKEQLELFRVKWAHLLSAIRESHGPEVEIHLFPAIPNSIAVEIGRAILPKSDPLLTVYEHSPTGFRPVVELRPGG